MSTFEELLQDIRDLREDIQETREALSDKYGDPDYDEAVTVVVEESNSESKEEN